MRRVRILLISRIDLKEKQDFFVQNIVKKHVSIDRKKLVKKKKKNNTPPCIYIYIYIYI